MLKINKSDLIKDSDHVKKFFSKFDTVLWCLGIGDFLTFDSYIPEYFYKNLKKIFLFTSRNQTFEKLIKANKNYESVEIIFADNKYDKGEIYKIDGYLDSFLKKHNLKKENCFLDDLMIWNLPKIESINPKVSSFFTQELCELKYTFTEDDYCIIFPSTKNTRNRRFFTFDDWQETFKILKYYKYKGVVLGHEKFKIPKIADFVDLTSKTSILEAIELTKKAKMYIGIDSFLSVLAMQTFSEEKIYIKSVENHLYENIKFFSPFKNINNFVNNRIKIRDKKILNII